MTLAHHALVLLSLASVVLCAQPDVLAAQDSVPIAAAPDIARAEEFAEQAYGAYERRDYAGAVALYEQAYAASPSANILYNIAKVYDLKLHNRAQAIAYYTRYLDDPGAEPERARGTRMRIAMLRELEQSTTSAPNKRSVTRGRVAAAPPAAPAQGARNRRIAGIVLTSVGVASLGVGAGFGLSARADADRAHALCDGNRCSAERGVTAADDARRSANIATAAFAAGGTLALLGVGLWVWGKPSASRERASLAVGATLAGALGPNLSGRW
jgi:tetratricopeptide (TPR) repeat protein